MRTLAIQQSNGWSNNRHTVRPDRVGLRTRLETSVRRDVRKRAERRACLADDRSRLSRALNKPCLLRVARAYGGNVIIHAVNYVFEINSVSHLLCPDNSERPAVTRTSSATATEASVATTATDVVVVPARPAASAAPFRPLDCRRAFWWCRTVTEWVSEWCRGIRADRRNWM